MDKSSSSSSSKLKHRFAQLLLGSSCTTTIAASTVGQTKRHRQSSLSATTGEYRRLRRVAPIVHVSIDCGARRSVKTSEPLVPLMTKEEAEENHKKKERKLLTESATFYHDAKQIKSKKAPDQRRTTKGIMRVEAKKKLLSNAYGFTSSSSMDSENNELGLFSSDEEQGEEDESATLFSSKSFSSDSSVFYHNSRKTKNNNRCTRRRSSCKSMKSTRRPPPRRHPKHVRAHFCDDGSNNQALLRPLISISSTEKKEKPSEAAATESNAGFAVVKRSSDPYSDFSSSMVEMIVERGMSRAPDLERLLHSYLSLNSPRHHEVILTAFAEICEAFYGQ